MSAEIKIGDRVYLRNAIAGDPGMVQRFERGKFVVAWPDMPEVGETRHYPEDLLVDESFAIQNLGLDPRSAAA